MKKKTFVIALVIALCLATVASASSSSWNSSGKIFKPVSGTLTATFTSTYARTSLDFKYSPSNASQIANYYSQGTHVVGMDIKNVPSNYNTGADMMSAYSITTTIPNAKTDLENDDLLGDRNEEAEVVSLSPVNGYTTYNMTVAWMDYRAGVSGNNGQWNVNAELSTKGVIDYNTADWEGCTQLTYGKDKGKP